MPSNYKSDMRGEFDNSVFMPENGKTGRKFVDILKTKTGIAAMAIAAIATIGYGGYKAGWFSPSTTQQCPEQKHISAIA